MTPIQRLIQAGWSELQATAYLAACTPEESAAIAAAAAGEELRRVLDAVADRLAGKNDPAEPVGPADPPAAKKPRKSTQPTR